jgi:hypothetical protein
MADFKFYLVYIKAKSGVTEEAITTKLNLANDWYRLGGGAWVLYTNSDADKWFARLSPLVKQDGYLFITLLDISDKQGWMKKDFWKWLRREADS